MPAMPGAQGTEGEGGREGGRGTKKEVFSRCKIYDVQVSGRERTSAKLRGVFQSESLENRR